MTVHGSAEAFNTACREALHELGLSEGVGENAVRYPHHREGVTSHKEGDRRVVVDSYMSTMDKDGAKYEIRMLRLGDLDPIVMLETTATDPYRLVNTLTARLSAKEIPVDPY
jgi:hypothetical protein